MLIECSNITKSFGNDPILKNISFKVNDHEKVSIVGVNGAGKTTILRILLKEEEYDSGDLFESKDLTIGCLQQQPTFNLDETVYNTVLEVFDNLIKIENRMRELELLMASNHDETILNEYDRLTNQFQENDGFSYPSRITGVLKGLGFESNDFDKPVSSLSGGQKTRLSLARLLLSQPKLLILDEPTNHLDSNAISFLENFLKNYPNGIIVVSHDRYFINQVTNKIIEIENGKSKTYECNYDEYSRLKINQRAIDLKHYVDQQKEIKKIQSSIDTLKSYNRQKTVRRAESKEKMLAKMPKVAKPESLPSSITINFNPKNDSGFDVLRVKDLAVGYTTNVIEHIDLDIKKEERIAIVGENGIGKTTLFRAILGQLKASAGSIRFGSKVDLAYYDQEHASLHFDKTVFKEISDEYPRMTNTEIRNTLAMFNFRGDDVFKEIAMLSGGEKGRVSLCKILLKQANLLILDEPTNHLDIASKEVLEEALLSFKGTIIFISHDRYFINKIATRVIEITPNKAISYQGGYDNYITAKQDPLTTSNKGVNEDYISMKQKQATLRKNKNKIKSIERDISKLETEIERFNKQLTSEEVLNDYLKYNEINDYINDLETKLNALLEEWELLQ